MARATRSSTADLKRKRSPENQEAFETNDNAPTKLQKKELELADDQDDEETRIDCSSILAVLQAEDKQDLLHRVYKDSGLSLHSLLTTQTPVSTLKAAINSLRPIASQRAQKSNTAAQQDGFCNLALALVDQVPSETQHIHQPNVFEQQPSSPPRQKPVYALVQHLPSGDWWTSTSSISDPATLQTGNAELVAILPTPSSSSSDKPPTTIGSYCPKPTIQKRTVIAPRRVPTGAFLDYGLYSSFAPSFDSDGEVVGRKELGQLLWHREEKKRTREAIRREQAEGTGSIVEISSQEPQESVVGHQDEESPIIPDEELEALLGPKEVHSIKAALNSLELEKSVQQLLERNQRALVRLSELQKQRLMSSPTSTAEAGSEEWDTAQAILDSLTLLASLRPQSSSHDAAAIIPPPSVLHKLHRTLAIQPTPSWSGTLPPGRTTALRDDSTVKIRPSTVPAVPVATTGTPSNVATPSAATASASTLGHYGYSYGTQQGHRAPAAAPGYTQYKPSTYYTNYNSQQQQGYYGQQPYSNTSANQVYGAQYAAWMGYYQAQQAQQQASGGTSGRGTPLPPATPTAAPSYSSFFGSAAATNLAAAAAAFGTPLAARTPAVANTVATPTSVTPYTQATPGMVPTLPLHLRTSSTPQQPATVNGTTGGFLAQSSYMETAPSTTVPTYQPQTQPAT
ncbi:hypothetical protein CPB83DRAFT_888429 [Crepidotus variabilis]|uniref:Uncharacterized protein n=1 Tax=Crepidotus variabilis TaxID=179855 RepID=A0A9P6EVL0_9AGAR|nr:hypothetical protein CPB83DRAFT_888429 [Crepidotus variabilis]